MLPTPAWVLNEAIDTFFFDCDGTLSLIEGINFLASMNGVAEKVHQITERCMGRTGMNLKDYRQRLDYVQPTINQINLLSKSYQEHLAPGAYELIQLLRHLNKKIYIISAGIKQAVEQFAQNLGISANNVLAVEVNFDDQGIYQGFDEQSNLTQSNGKTIEIASIIKAGERSLLVGDGITDWEAREQVTRFIGFAGISPKLWVKHHSDFYINSDSFFPIIPLGLSVSEITQLSSPNDTYYEQGLKEIDQSVVLIKENNHVYYSGS